MDNLSENNSGQGNNPAAKQPASTGSMLREARENLGLTVADVAGQIKFAPRQIEALEADDFKNLPEAAFLRGFVRSYAKILRLDAELLLASMPSTKAAAAELIPASVDVPFPNEQSNRQQNLLWLGAALLLAVIVAGFAVWHFMTPLKETKEQAKVTKIETPVALPADAKIISEPLVLKSSTIVPSVHDVSKARSSAAQSSVPEAKTMAKVKAAQSSVQEAKTMAKVKAAKTSVSKAASQVPATSSETLLAATPQTSELRLVFGEESWTEIKDKDGKVISSQINPAGSELRVEGNAPFSMLIGHAASASLYYRGKQVDLKPYINQYSEVAHLKLK
ncbi:MAG: RodZ domain-containing protein [Gallionella sp.]